MTIEKKDAVTAMITAIQARAEAISARTEAAEAKYIASQARREAEKLPMPEPIGGTHLAQKRAVSRKIKMQKPGSPQKRQGPQRKRSAPEPVRVAPKRTVQPQKRGIIERILFSSKS